MSMTYLPEHLAFVKRHSGKLKDSEIAKLFNRKFGTRITEKAVNGVRRRLGFSLRAKSHHIYSATEIAFIRAWSGKMPDLKLAATFNAKFGTDVSARAISQVRHRNGMDLSCTFHTDAERRFVLKRREGLTLRELYGKYRARFGEINYNTFESFAHRTLRLEIK
ncbi:MAG: hypothetical protein LBW85_14540 [Deltaproteobacteria bacterium]|jgi:transposase|nr:hypothetical protein [Deltaproteobacteria bacterium]